MASATFEKLSLNSSICVFSGQDISDGVLPEELWEKDNLPSLLFLNLDAMNNLFKCFSEELKSWVNVIDKIVIDEVHTILSEMSFLTTNTMFIPNSQVLDSEGGGRISR
jgi:hypothetical protein